MVSVIIPTTTGGLTHLAGLMPELSKEIEDINGELIVIDNNSKDGTGQYLSNYRCTIVHNTDRKNFSQSLNVGSRIASTGMLLYLNNDTRIKRGFIREMLDTFSVSENIGVVGCLLYRLSDRKIQHAGVCFTDNYVPYELGLPVPDVTPGLLESDPRVHSVREVPSVTAACMMVPHDVWGKIHFDEGYFYGWEDTDFVLKARERGYKVYYTGKSHVFHVHMGSKNAGRLALEAQNRARYDAIWVDTGRAKKVLGDFRTA